MEQVILNLLQNAIKFTPRGEVRVRVFRAPRSRVVPAGSGLSAEKQENAADLPDSGSDRNRECVYITVEDTGIGFDRDLLDHMFETFHQGTVSSRQQAGLGLGLALVKGMTEGHDGRVWAESPGPGKGSRFTVELPMIVQPASVPVSGPAVDAPGSIRLLLVEDNQDTRELFVNSLTMMGYEIESAVSAEEGLELLREYRPELIISDIALPGMDGYEFLRRVRHLPELADVPAFAVTGHGQEHDVAQAYEAGYARHFVKPVDLNALDKQIRALFSADTRNVSR